jgi:uncharacterized protein
MKNTALKSSYLYRLSSIFILYILFLIPVFTFAFTNPGKPKGFVNDFANILNENTKSNLELKLNQYEKQTGNEISVVTVKSLEDETIETYAVKLFEVWGIGKKGADNGALLLVAPNERKVRIEVGYGLEGYLTDINSSVIIQDYILPEFKKGNYDTGVIAGVDKMISVIGGERLSQSTPLVKDIKYMIFKDWIFFLFFVPLWLASVLGASKSWWAGGVLGGFIGILIGFINQSFAKGLIYTILFIIGGLIFDYIFSKMYKNSMDKNGRAPWFFMNSRGGGGSGGGGFGGFGGGGSGGGGSSGSW